MWLILCLLVIPVFLWYFSKKRALQYWQSRGFPTLPHSNFFFGDCGPALLARKSFAEVYRDFHVYFKDHGHKVGGFYLLNLPMLIVTDNELMKRMLQIDFDAFADRGVEVDPIGNPLSMHVFSLDGEYWARVRRKLSPTFTSGKIKTMFPIVEKHIDVLIEVTRKMCDGGRADINYSDWLDKAGVDVIGHVAFGLDCNILQGKNDEFYEMTRRITRPKIWKAMKMLLTGLTNPANIVALLSSDEEMSDFFIKLVRDTVEYRRRNKIVAHDFLQLMINLLEEEEKEPGAGLTMAEITAQAFVFFVAGFETTSRTVTFCLYALAEHPEIQQKLREEIAKELRLHNNEYLYDWVMNNEYLDMVIKETLRLHVPVITLNRMATRDYRLEDTGLVIPKGTCLVYSTFGFHHDADNWEKPMEFIPERFSKANAENIKPMTNIPFGDGPRFCIGKRFGYLQSKMELIKVLMNFEVLRSERTAYPLQISPLTTNLLLTAKDPIYFKFKPL